MSTPYEGFKKYALSDGLYLLPDTDEVVLQKKGWRS